MKVDGKYGFWATNKWGKKYFRELEKRGNSYYIKGTNQMHLPPAEYHTVMEYLKYENLSTEQIKSKTFAKEINGITYFIKNTDAGCIVTGRKDK